MQKLKTLVKPKSILHPVDCAKRVHQLRQERQQRLDAAAGRAIISERERLEEFEAYLFAACDDAEKAQRLVAALEAEDTN